MTLEQLFPGDVAMLIHRLAAERPTAAEIECASYVYVAGRSCMPWDPHWERQGILPSEHMDVRQIYLRWGSADAFASTRPSRLAKKRSDLKYYMDTYGQPRDRAWVNKQWPIRW